MTTKGMTLRRHDAFLTYIGPNGELQPLHELPARIAEAEARGHPVIVDVVPPLEEGTQRLYAALGVLVRFTRGDA